MKYRELSAEDKSIRGKVTLILDGHDVSDRAYWARVPLEPEIESPGSVKLYTEWPPVFDENRSNLRTEHKTGIVSWKWKFS
jgi:hypothetical protein